MLHRSRETHHAMPAAVAFAHVDPDSWPTQPRTAAAWARAGLAARHMTHARARPAARQYARQHASMGAHLAPQLAAPVAAAHWPVGSSDRLGSPHAGAA